MAFVPREDQLRALGERAFKQGDFQPFVDYVVLTYRTLYELITAHTSLLEQTLQPQLNEIRQRVTEVDSTTELVTNVGSSVVNIDPLAISTRLDSTTTGHRLHGGTFNNSFHNRSQYIYNANPLPGTTDKWTWVNTPSPAEFAKFEADIQVQNPHEVKSLHILINEPTSVTPTAFSEGMVNLMAPLTYISNGSQMTSLVRIGTANMTISDISTDKDVSSYNLFHITLDMKYVNPQQRQWQAPAKTAFVRFLANFFGCFTVPGHYKITAVRAPPATSARNLLTGLTAAAFPKFVSTAFNLGKEVSNLIPHALNLLGNNKPAKQYATDTIPRSPYQSLQMAIPQLNAILKNRAQLASGALDIALDPTLQDTTDSGLTKYELLQLARQISNDGGLSKLDYIEKRGLFTQSGLPFLA